MNLLLAPLTFLLAMQAAPPIVTRAPDPKPEVTIRSPYALLAVRGTTVFAGPSNGVFGVFVQLPPGASLERSSAVLKKVEDILAKTEGEFAGSDIVAHALEILRDFHRDGDEPELGGERGLREEMDGDVVDLHLVLI